MRPKERPKRLIWIPLLVLVLSLLPAAPAGARPGSAPDTTDRINDGVNAAEPPVPARPSGEGTPAAHPQVSGSYGKLPLHFEANRGQTDATVKFLSRGPGHTLFLTATEAVLVLTKGEPPAPGARRAPTLRPEDRGKVTRSALRTSFVGANRDPRLEAQAELPGKANYFIGKDPANWRTGVPTYARVRYHDLYPGIDLVYYGNQSQLEYDFVVAPGADPKTITLAFRGADRLEVDAQGDLVLHTAAGALRHRRPVIYQEIDGFRRAIAGGYVLKGPHRVGFQVAAYDRSRPLVIDPTLFYSTYLGGSAAEGGSQGGLAVDAAGNAYVAGETDSLDFPTTAGSFQPSRAGGRDGFVTKLNSTGSALVYSTYLGGSGFDRARAIALDAAGNAYVTGMTTSSNFPTTVGAFDTMHNGGEDAFVTKLDATGSALVYSTYLGGSASNEFGAAIAVDAAGSAYVAGTTGSTNFPTTLGAFDTTLNGFDAFVTKFNGSGTGLVYSTYLGGSVDEGATGIAIDTSGNAYVTGVTSSSDFPTTALAYQSTLAGSVDAFVTKLNATGAALDYSTYLGGSGHEQGVGIALDVAGNAYVVGFTESTNFPTTASAFQPSYAGGFFDAFLTKLDPLGTSLVYSTYLGGSGRDEGNSIAVDTLGQAHVTGQTDSTDFPTAAAFQPACAGAEDAFVTKLDATGGGLVYSSYLGGSGFDRGTGIALDTLPSPNAYVTGQTASTDFPTTDGAFQPFLAGNIDAFVTKITDVVLPPPPTVGKVTGGGSINVTDGIGTFGFIVQRQAVDASIQGQLQYVNHATKERVHSVLFDSFAIVGNTATFHGMCTNNGAPCTFTVNVTDNDEPGVTDTFTISIDLSPTDGGTLRSGNVQIHE